MRRTHRLAAVAIAIGLALSVSLAPAASAADGSGDYTPSKSKWRAYMINVAGSVLGQAMPPGWQREQAANRFAVSGFTGQDQLNQAYGYTEMVRNGSGDLVNKYPARGSGTYDDYILDEMEKQIAGKSTRSKQTVPATPAKTFAKTVGGAAAAYTGLEVGTFLGSMFAPIVGSWFGIDDVTGAVCGMTAGSPGQALTSWVTGQDCEAWEIANSYPANGDAAAGWNAATLNGGSVQWMGWSAARSGVVYACQAYTAPSTLVVPGVGTARLEGLTTSGAWAAATAPQTGSTDSSWNTVKSSCAALGGPLLSLSANMIPSAGQVATYKPLYRWAVVVGGSSVPVGTQATQSTGDPERTQNCTITYTDGTSDTASGTPYKESTGTMSPAPCPAPDAGKTVQDVAVTETGNGAPKELYKSDTTDAYKDWASKQECATGMCLLDLLVQTSTDKYASCFDLQEGCAGWFEDPSKSTKYTCRYGLDEVALSECNVYAGLFTPGRIEVGAPYSDPMTGTWSGGKNSPKPDEKAMGQGIQDPAATYRSCDGMNVTGFDPVGFVMRPIQCALEWAFIPRPLVVEAEAASIKEKWEDTAPGAVVNTVAGWGFAAPSGGCGGLTVPWSSILGHGVPDWNILNACPGSPLVPAATASMIILSISAVIGLIYVVTASFGGAVGYGGLGRGRGGD